jgi:flagella synthesis protein FlgN
MQGSAAAPNRLAFVAALEAELAAYTELCELLRAEQTSLERGDVDQLQQLTELKSRQVERLATLGATRVAYLHAVQLSASPAGMQEWLASHAGAQQPALRRTWQRLLELAGEARALNELNGGLVATRLNHSQAALAALHAAGRQHLVYGPDGQNDFRAANRDLGRA